MSERVAVKIISGDNDSRIYSLRQKDVVALLEFYFDVKFELGCFSQYPADFKQNISRLLKSCSDKLFEDANHGLSV